MSSLQRVLERIEESLQDHSAAIAEAVTNTVQAREKCHELASHFHALATAVDYIADAAKLIAMAAENEELTRKLEGAQRELRESMDGVSQQRR